MRELLFHHGIFYTNSTTVDVPHFRYMVFNIEGLLY